MIRSTEEADNDRPSSRFDRSGSGAPGTIGALAARYASAISPLLRISGSALFNNVDSSFSTGCANAAHDAVSSSPYKKSNCRDAHDCTLPRDLLSAKIAGALADELIVLVGTIELDLVAAERAAARLDRALGALAHLTSILLRVARARRALGDRVRVLRERAHRDRAGLARACLGVGLDRSRQPADARFAERVGEVEVRAAGADVYNKDGHRWKRAGAHAILSAHGPLLSETWEAARGLP